MCQRTLLTQLLLCFTILLDYSAISSPHFGGQAERKWLQIFVAVEELEQKRSWLSKSQPHGPSAQNQQAWLKSKKDVVVISVPAVFLDLQVGAESRQCLLNITMSPVYSGHNTYFRYALDKHEFVHWELFAESEDFVLADPPYSLRWVRNYQN